MLWGLGHCFMLFCGVLALFRALESRCEGSDVAHLDEHFTPMKRVSVRYVVPANDVTSYPADAETQPAKLQQYRRAA